ncbi:MAG: tetratricopeptide repeat protein [Bacteroidia bacterium]|nr:tetratricopeptide repeat protein [Bacteroidia bacterium]
MKLQRIVLIAVLFFASHFVYAQKTLNYEHASKIYKDAYDLFYKEKYASAQQLFTKYIKLNAERENTINATYYAGVCGMELFNADGISTLLKVVQNYPEHPKAKLAMFQLGRYFYRTKDNKRAIHYLEQVDALSLTPEEAEEYWFIKGYCYFKTDKFSESKLAFKTIKDKKGKYYDPSNYYYGYVVYKEGEYDEALNHFTRIKDSKTFGPLSQVYIAQIYFSRKQYEEVVKYAANINNKEVADDVAGLVGQSYFYLKNYSQAIPFLETYNANPPVQLTPNDIYRIAYAYMMVNNYDKALTQFVRVTDKTDTLSQYAHYHLAECYLKTDKKPSARLAFDRAYKLGFNNEITELALFNYGKISYELNQPDAIKEFLKFVNDYPESKYIDEAKGILGDLLMSTRNYKQAITVIESIKKPTAANNEAYQRVLYYYAEEQYLKNNFTDADAYFVKSQQFDFDKKLFALAHFWQGEIAYKQNNYTKAEKEYSNFLTHESDIKYTRFYPLASYNLGYCYIKTEQYNKGITAFKKFLESNYAQSAPELYTDAALRVADCYFVSKDYQKALDHYEMIVSKKMNGSDYALFQKALIYGLLGKPSDKILSLQQIVNNYSRSLYIDDAIFEISNVYLQNDEYEKAIASFDNIIKNYPNSVFIRKAMQYKGLAQRNAGNDKEALSTFKQLVQKHCNTEEAKQVLAMVENIYVSHGETDEYLDFLKSTECKSISPSYQDSISYDAAFNQYKNGDCEKSSKLFGQYINKFPGGYFVLKANYYKAECDFKLKNLESALQCYEFVALQNRNDFTERSTRQTAVLYYNKKNWRKAFEFYGALERIASSRDNMQVAVTGLLKTSMLGFSVDTAAMYSFKYINSGLSTKDGLLDANTNIARYYMSQKQWDSAFVGWNYLIKETKNIYAAEAKYNVALIAFNKKEYNNAKKIIFEISEKFSTYTLWYEKAYLLLAEVYFAQNDLFQAKATLQSLVENLDDGENKEIAKTRLKAIMDKEEADKPKQIPTPEKEIEQY